MCVQMWSIGERHDTGAREYEVVVLLHYKRVGGIRDGPRGNRITYGRRRVRRQATLARYRSAYLLEAFSNVILRIEVPADVRDAEGGLNTGIPFDPSWARIEHQRGAVVKASENVTPDYSVWSEWSLCWEGVKTRRRRCVRPRVCGGHLRLEIAGCQGPRRGGRPPPAPGRQQAKVSARQLKSDPPAFHVLMAVRSSFRTGQLLQALFIILITLKSKIIDRKYPSGLILARLTFTRFLGGGKLNRASPKSTTDSQSKQYEKVTRFQRLDKLESLFAEVHHDEAKRLCWLRALARSQQPPTLVGGLRSELINCEDSKGSWKGTPWQWGN
ncbi:hypothetical protein EVAR_6589_1 [Eumeta japonica]|uniref:Uncharacterized protein n=1 Tax=Eumeta variegata TaxID=151549 RepID=A0A4C1SQJ9_EUMVA|nr:hypothetical protein EVAR_6589_1 [Eumeta japonica]